ncbi:E3 ubiquitin/ISG15 ligase TRIM25-like [Engystomops pustulosus]|uniref:E3 ubiquitin/ISG15 ligase TRIM25-like n=1 Tax=Engystomops pustulosus TaxID=76066 RepID=UPI003AFA64E2
MASADLRRELLCSICLTIYTDPVNLRCGHNFCQVCISQNLNTQNRATGYSCPECRTVYRRRPALMRNITLRNVVEHVRSTRPPLEEVTGICCTYCIHSPVPAVKSCLHCEASLCDDHLNVHSKEPEHVLTDPSTSLENRKCSVHKKILEYYCTEDKTCICVSCRLAEEHQGHQVEMLVEASEKKKEKLRDVLQNLTTKREETEEGIQSLEERSRKVLEKASGDIRRVTALFKDINVWKNDLKKRILSEISKRERQESLSLSYAMQKLGIKEIKLSRKMKDIEELCNMTDPLTVLQKPDTGDLCDPEEGGGDGDTGGHDTTYDADFDVISFMLHEGFSDIMRNLETIVPPQQEEILSQPPNVQSRGETGEKQDEPERAEVMAEGVGDIVVDARDGGIYGEGPVDIILDINTAYNNLLISNDLKTANWTDIKQKRPDTAERFQDYPQVMNSRGFTSGRHYWDVEIRRSAIWMVGMCYPSIDKRGDQSHIGDNNKSWVLCAGFKNRTNYSVVHDEDMISLHTQCCEDRIRISLDYEAGKLSFYELCDPIRHLHTFTTTFTEPLHAVWNIGGGHIQILGQGISGSEDPS